MSSNPGVELKGGMYTFMSLKLHTGDLEVIDRILADKVNQAPAFFKDTPVVIDLTILEQLEKCAEIDTRALLDCIKGHKLVPIVASIKNKTSPLAESIAIPLIEGNERKLEQRDTSSAAKIDQDANQSGNDDIQHPDDDVSAQDASGREDSADQSAHDDTAVALPVVSREVEHVVKAPLFIDKPVRSGQQIYARDTDLIVLGPIGPGAEVIADNNIHIYGALRGRALCGVSGNTSSRIFCQSLEAELVSVAGNYRMLETIPEELRGRPAQIWLDNDKLNIESL
ncbi:MAG: septum site-determining protein MinC [Granulosicoccus sp.]